MPIDPMGDLYYSSQNIWGNSLEPCLHPQADFFKK